MGKIFIITLFFLGFALRFYYFAYPLGRSSELTVDEAVYGVSALQILGGARPVFYPAQDYTGSFSAYLSAVVFQIFGVSAGALKIVPFLFSLATIFFIYRLSLSLFGEKIAFFTLLIASLGTPFWNNWSSRAGTGYVEVALVGCLILILARNFVLALENTSRGKLLALGILSGLGFWIQPTAVYFIGPVFILIFFHWGLARTLRALPILATGFVLGASPAIYYNLWIRPAATAEALFKMPWGVRGALIKLVSEGFPVLLGGRTANSLIDFHPLTSMFVYGLFLVSLIFFLKKFLVKRSVNLTRRPEFPILLTFAVSLMVFLLSTPFNQLSIEPRYVFPIYILIPIILGSFLADLWSRWRLWLFILLIFYLLNSALGLFKASPLTFVDGYSFSPLISHLRQSGVSYAITTPSVGHRLTFFSEGRVKSQVRGGGITEARFESINREVTRARDLEPRLVAYVTLLEEPEIQSFITEVKGMVGEKYSLETVGGSFMVLRPQPKP